MSPRVGHLPAAQSRIDVTVDPNAIDPERGFLFHGSAFGHVDLTQLFHGHLGAPSGLRTLGVAA